MASTSPTPTTSGLVRRTSQRQGLRNISSRTGMARSDTFSAQPSAASSQRPRQYVTVNRDNGSESSDDEIFVPMKLSAFTKALLNDGTPESAERASSPPRTRRTSVMSSSTSSTTEERRRVTRPGSVSSRGRREEPRESYSSRPTSPARSMRSRDSSPSRKRVVRLSTTPQSTNQTHRRFTSVSRSNSIGPGYSRPQSWDKSSADRRDMSTDMHTPAQGKRVVRITTGSSQKPQSSSTSNNSSDPSRLDLDQEQDQGDDFGNGSLYQIAGRASVSGYANRPRVDIDNGAPLQSSMRVKRVGRLTGTFLSGPARRGRRRQSEEDDAGDENHIGGHETEGQGQDGYQYGLDAQSSFYGETRKDYASGSPLGNRDPPRNMSRHERADSRMASARRSPKPYEDENGQELDLHYRLPPSRAENRAETRSSLDQENKPPSLFRQSRTAADLVLDKASNNKPSKIITATSPRDTSPDRHPLSAMSKNTPHRPAPAPPAKPSILERSAKAAPAPVAASAQPKKRNLIKFNGKYYTRLDCLGRGGSGKVYRVTSDTGEMFALKRVSLEHADETMVRGYKGEIDLLKKLGRVNRVIHLYDYEMNDEKQLLSVLMEMGELDLESLMGGPRPNIADMKFDPVFVRHYWKEMLECVNAVHEYDVVHSDLKPANFVLVKGRLKLIDFGIANAIQTDETVNVHRETQVGTPNYMSPESLLDSNATHGRVTGRPKLMKLGKPSDVWSLGCILYRMVYGTAPFQHIANPMARCQAIIDWDHKISFPSHAMGGVAVSPSLIRLLKRCLNRDQHLRPTCEEMLHHTDPFLYPVEVTMDGAGIAGVLPIDQEMLGRIIQNVVNRCRTRVPSDAEAMSVLPGMYWSSVKKAMDARNGVSSGPIS